MEAETSTVVLPPSSALWLLDIFFAVAVAVAVVAAMVVTVEEAILLSFFL